MFSNWNNPKQLGPINPRTGHKPSNLVGRPWNPNSMSLHETVGRNIIRILKRTQDEWRILSWEEYKQALLKDNNEFDEDLHKFSFNDLAPHTASFELARAYTIQHYGNTDA